jgi:DNA-binding transcriptional LysR family regulator
VTLTTGCCGRIDCASVDVEMRHLRALIAVSEELNFTRAAQRLHLTQQALSGQIRQLEERVGNKLVERDTRRVELTPAGLALCEQARPLLAGVELAVASARATPAESSRLTVGYITALTHRLVARTMGRYTAEHPEVDVTIHFGDFLDPSGGLRDGSADVAFVYGEFDTSGLELTLLFSEPRGLAIAADHPLAQQTEVTIEQLIAQPIVDVPMTDPVSRDFWIDAEHRAGRPPRIGATVRTLDAMIEAIGVGLGVAATIAPGVDAIGAGAGVVFRPVPGLKPLDFFIARRADDHRAQVCDFIQTARRQHTQPAADSPVQGSRARSTPRSTTTEPRLPRPRPS